MQNFTLSGDRWFDSLSQPALLVKNGTIYYYNEAAQALFSDSGTVLNVGDPTPEVLPEGDGDCVTEVVIGGCRWSLQAQKQEAGTLYLFTRRELADTERMAQLAALLRLRLSTLSISAEGLHSGLGEFLQKQNQRWISRQNQGLYQLLRLTQQLEFFGQTEDELRLYYPSSVLELGALGEELTTLLTPLSEEAGHSFTLQPPKETLYVAANEILLRRLVYNLTANAFEAGGNVTVKLKKQGAYAVLTFLDDGKGIPGKKYSTLFDSERKDWDSHATGFGLGLPLCQRVANLYGGRLVVSPRKKGTQVTLSLPLLRSGFQGMLRSPTPILSEDSSSQLLTELSGVLPFHCYGSDELL